MKREEMTPENVADYFANTYKGNYTLNDSVHREEHFRAVEAAGHLMNEQLCLGQDPVLITIVAWVHDLFAWDRKNHHVMAEQWVLLTEDPVIGALSIPDQAKVAKACLEYRASWKGEFSSMLSELMSSADRGMDTPDQILYRAFKFGVERDGLSVDQGLIRAVEHLSEKFGRNGYMRLPGIYAEFYTNALEQRYETIEVFERVSLKTLKEVAALSFPRGWDNVAKPLPK